MNETWLNHQVLSQEFALHYAGIRAIEKGYPSYRIRHRVFSLAPDEIFGMKAFNELWLLTYISAGVTIESETGIYDTAATPKVDEHSVEHSGVIKMINTTDTVQTVRWIQVILKT